MDNKDLNFKTRAEANQFLKENVFSQKDFMRDIRETAKTLNLSYSLVYKIVTRFLPAFLYNIDKCVSYKKNITFYVKGFFKLIINKNDNKED